MSLTARGTDSVFPTGSVNMLRTSLGLTIRDWFATFAPEPSTEDISSEFERDRLRNPHNDPHKPKIRSKREIIAELRYRYADSMISEREQQYHDR